MQWRIRVGLELQQAARDVQRALDLAALHQFFGFPNIDDERAALGSLLTSRLGRDARDHGLGRCEQFIDAFFHGGILRRHAGIFKAPRLLNHPVSRATTDRSAASPLTLNALYNQSAFMIKGFEGIQARPDGASADVTTAALDVPRVRQLPQANAVRLHGAAALAVLMAHGAAGVLRV